VLQLNGLQQGPVFPRYAIYYCPEEDSNLWRRGSAWLGRDLKTDEIVPHPKFDDLSLDDFHRHTSSPRKYGLHATLKAPMHLGYGATEEALLRAVRKLAEKTEPFVIPELALGRLGKFLALVPKQKNDALDQLAGQCVKELDKYREPPTEQELARRNISGLKSDERKNLMDWGYPYVLDAFRFHITLTNALPDANTGAAMLAIAKAYFQEELAQPLPIRSLCVCTQVSKTAAFKLRARFNLGE